MDTSQFRYIFVGVWDIVFNNGLELFIYPLEVIFKIVCSFLETDFVILKTFCCLAGFAAI